ncbi:MAG TPA: MFS transporter [Longilinea sp.]|nr:MFS transporter [Longilinea sp.]
MAVTEAVRKPNVLGHARRSAVVVFFVFMLLHQTDKLLIGPLQTPIMDTFHMTYTQWGLINTGALIVGAVCYPLWGWLNDKYHRGKILALASLIWGSTTWISAIAPTFPVFLVTRSSTGIDDSSYAGMFSLLADYFSPKARGKIYGFLQLTQPIGYLLGMILALFLAGAIGWRAVFYFTGSLGIILAIVIFFLVKEQPRGSGEEELEGVETSSYQFSWKTAAQLFVKRSMILIFLQGFFGVFPWNVITYYFFGYLQTERGYSADTQFMIMAPAVIFLALGYPLGGFLGDWMFKRTKSGRMIVGTFGVFMGLVLLWITMNIPASNALLFAILLMATALFMPLASPNVLSTMYDISLPEIRSTANSIESFVESIGAATAPLIAGAIADAYSVGSAILWICTVAWGLCFLFFIGAVILVPHDIDTLHAQLRERAELEKAKQEPA